MPDPYIDKCAFYTSTG